MWRYPFLNLGFVILVITIVTLQHSVTVFGPTAHSRVATSRRDTLLRWTPNRREVHQLQQTSAERPRSSMRSGTADKFLTHG